MSVHSIHPMGTYGLNESLHVLARHGTLRAGEGPGPQPQPDPIGVFPGEIGGVPGEVPREGPGPQPQPDPIGVFPGEYFYQPQETFSGVGNVINVSV